MKTARSGYTSIPGSNDVPRASHEKPKRVAVLGDAIALPLAVFDSVALDLEPEEFAVYLHLIRLAWADGVDCCRVSRAELERRLRMSQLRLGKALAGLVEKKHVALVDRNRDGTLYRVPLPHAHATSQARPASHAHPASPARPASRAQAHRDATRADAAVVENVKITGNEKSMVASVGDLARRVLEQSSRATRGRSPDEVLEELLGLVEDGYALTEIADAVDRFLREAPKTAPIAEIGRYVRAR